MPKTRFLIPLLLALILWAPLAPARAAESYLDLLSASMAGEINETFKNKILIETPAPITAGLYRFKDLTGRFAPEAPILRELLFGKLSANSRFVLMGLESMDATFDSLYPFRTLDELSQEQLQQLARAANIDYVFSAKIVSQDSRPVLQLFIYNARKGVLLFTPMFPVESATAPATSVKPAAPPDQPVETVPDTRPADTAPRTAALPNMLPATGTPVIPSATGARAFQNITSGEFHYVTGLLPDSPIVDFEPMNLDDDTTPEIAFLNTDSMVIVNLDDTRATKFWSSEYRKSFPRRGLAGTLWFHRAGTKPLLFVSMNVFPRSIVYLWDAEKKSLDKVQNADQFVAHLDSGTGKRLVSEYGKGVISFSGKATRLVAAGGPTEGNAGFAIPFDYFSGCLLRVSDTSNALTITALSDENGIIKIYQGDGKILAETDAKYGGAVDCWRNPRTDSMYVLSATDKSVDDRLVMFRLTRTGSGKFEFVKQWVSGSVAGAITRAKFADLNGDRLPEVLAVEETSGSQFRFFYTVPGWPEEEY